MNTGACAAEALGSINPVGIDEIRTSSTHQQCDPDDPCRRFQSPSQDPRKKLRCRKIRKKHKSGVPWHDPLLGRAGPRSSEKGDNNFIVPAKNLKNPIFIDIVVWLPMGKTAVVIEEQ